MSSGVRGSPAKTYAARAVLLVLALYVLFFCLPITKDAGKAVLGWEEFSILFLEFDMIALPFIIGHLLLWIGCACLATHHFWGATVFGAAALMISLAIYLICLFFAPWDPPNTGIYVKLVCMT